MGDEYPVEWIDIEKKTELSKSTVPFIVDAFKNELQACAFCGKELSLVNIGGIWRVEGKVSAVCQNISCMIRLFREKRKMKQKSLFVVKEFD